MSTNDSDKNSDIKFVKKDEQNFEEMLTDLEKLIKKLESGSEGLEQSIQLFEKGVGLYENCQKQLLKAEKKISLLTDKLKLNNE